MNSNNPNDELLQKRLSQVYETFEAVKEVIGTRRANLIELTNAVKIFTGRELIVEQIPLGAEKSGECRICSDKCVVSLDIDLDSMVFMQAVVVV